jgi:hypothetical protein
MTDNHLIDEIVDSIVLNSIQSNHLKHLIKDKGLGRKLSPDALINWCLKLSCIAIKIVKCLEYKCWANKRGQIKIKRFRSAGTLNPKRVVNKVVVHEAEIITKSHRVSLAVGEIYEVVTYHDSEVISKSFCEHYFVSNAGVVSNTRFPQSKYSVDDLIEVVKRKSRIGTIQCYIIKDLISETCYWSKNNKIKVFIYDLVHVM